MKPKKKGPVIHIPLAPVEVAMEIIALLGLVYIIQLLITSWSGIPQTVPTHFGLLGRPDAWGSKQSLLTFPLIALIVIYIPLTVLGRFPHIFNYPWPITEANAKSQYHLARTMLRFLKAETVWQFGLVSRKTIQVALGQAQGLGWNFLSISILIIFITVAVFLFLSYRAR